MIIKTKNYKLPNLIIIGAQKSGTTSLHHYLSLHPQIVMSKHKELNYFVEELQWKKGLRWYKSHFSGEAKIYGESSPHYAFYPLYKGVPQRMYSVIPDAKLIYMVRDPVKRLISQYLDRVKGGMEKRSIHEALEGLQDTRYVWFSKYFMQLEEYLKYYPKSSILVVTAEQLKNERNEVLKKIFQFLGVDDSFHCQEFTELRNVSKETVKRRKPRKFVRYIRSDKRGISFVKKIVYPLMPKSLKYKIFHEVEPGEKIERPVLDEKLKQKLINVLQEDVNKLRNFTGYDLKEWCL